MKVLTIVEIVGRPLTVEIHDDGEQSYRVQLSDDLTQIGRWDWYFEEYSDNPSLGRVRASQSATAIKKTGIELFSALFPGEAHRRYREYRGSYGLEHLQIYVKGSPAFHSIYWELLWDPEMDEPLCTRVPIVRVSSTADPSVLPIVHNDLNSLIVVARPKGKEDIALRTTSRPIVSGLRVTQMPVRVEIVRPGTFSSFRAHLNNRSEVHGAGFYKIVHFDMHGEIVGSAPVVKFETADGAPEGDPKSAQDIAAELKQHGISVVVLMACRSGRQDGDAVTSFGAQLSEAGIPFVVAMRYNVLSSMIRLFSSGFYEGLLGTGDPLVALSRARALLFRNKTRKTRLDLSLELDDWLTPVAYLRRAVSFSLAISQGRPVFFWEHADPESVKLNTTLLDEEAFFGRDLDILAVEQKILAAPANNILLLRGMAGIGKKTFLRHLAAWWQVTGFVVRNLHIWIPSLYSRGAARPEGPSPIDQLVQLFAQCVLDNETYQRLDTQATHWSELWEEVVRPYVFNQRHVAVFYKVDLLLDDADREEFRKFISSLAGAKTIILLCSRNGTEWLKHHTFENNIHELTILDDEAASLLAMSVLRANDRAVPATEVFSELQATADGSPLMIYVCFGRDAGDLSAGVGDLSSVGDLNALLSTLRNTVSFRWHANREEKFFPDFVSPFFMALSDMSNEQLLTLLALSLFRRIIPVFHLGYYRDLLNRHLPLFRPEWEPTLSKLDATGLIAGYDATAPYVYLNPLTTLIFDGLAENAAFQQAQVGASLDIKLTDAIERAFLELYSDIADNIIREVPHHVPDSIEYANYQFRNLLSAIELAEKREHSIEKYATALSVIAEATGYRSLATDLSRIAVDSSLSASKKADTRSSYPLEKILPVVQLMTSGRAGEAESVLREWRSNLSQFMGASGGTVPPGGEALVANLLDLTLASAGDRWVEAYRLSQSPNIRALFSNSDAMSHGGSLLLLLAGRAAQRIGELTEAREHLSAGLAHARKGSDRVVEASFLQELGATALMLSAPDEAERKLSEAFRLIKNIEAGEELRMAIHHDLGMVYLQQKKWEKCETAFRDALELSIKLRREAQQGATLYQLGRRAVEMQDCSEAKNYLRRAVGLLENLKDVNTLPITYDLLGDVLFQQGELDEAVRSYEAAAGIFRQLREHPREGVIQRKLAEVHANVGKARGARDALLNALVAAMGDPEAGDRAFEELLGKAAAWGGLTTPEEQLGFLFKAVGEGCVDNQFSQAFPEFLKEFCQDVTEEASPEAWALLQLGLGRSHASLATSGTGVAEEERATHARAALLAADNALKYFNKENHPADWAEAQLLLALAYFRSPGEDRNESCTSAILHCQKALEVVKIEEAKKRWADVQYRLGLAYSDRSASGVYNTKRSRYHYEMALMALTDEADPDLWASIHNALGLLFQGDVDALPSKEELEHFEQALRVWKKSRSIKQWADVCLNIATAHTNCAWTEDDPEPHLKAAIDYSWDALKALSRNDSPYLWARANFTLGRACQDMPTMRQQNLRRAIQAYEDALTVYTPEKYRGENDRTYARLARARELLDSLT